MRRVAMTNPFVSIKRLFEGSPNARRTQPSGLDGRVEKDFMKFDLTADARF
jgi:hypothetical protein